MWPVSTRTLARIVGTRPKGDIEIYRFEPYIQDIQRSVRAVAPSARPEVGAGSSY